MIWGHRLTDAERCERTHAARNGCTVEERRELQAAGQKWCAGCKNWHDRDEFGPNVSSPDGLAHQCAEWRRRYNRARYRRNKRLCKAG